MKIPAKQLIEELETKTRALIVNAELLLDQGADKLNAKPHEQGWSALECIEHLNLYGDYYIPELSRRMKGAPPSSPTFKSGNLGNYFAKVVGPGEGVKKMKTLKDKEPNSSNLGVATLEKFLGQQAEILGLLESAKKVDLTKTKTSISISKLIKLRIGDTFRVVIYHNQRHMDQAFRAIGLPK